MSIPSLRITLTALFFAVLMLPRPEACHAAGGRVRGNLASLSALESRQPVYLSLETREGLEQFALRLDSQHASQPGILHLVGEVRPRKGRSSPTAVAASRIGDRLIVYFTSSRRGVPSSASFSLAKEKVALQPTAVRVARASRFTLPCGSGRAHQVQRAKAGRSRGTAGVLGDGAFVPLNPPRILYIATRADYDFYLLHGEQSNAYIAASLHAAEVLYASPLGLRFRLASQQVQGFGAPSGGVPVSPVILLEAFRAQVMQEPTNYDVFHLFTGRSLEGRTIGIAYVRSACSGRTRFNIGLSRSISEPLQPILLAHEIAHNLGAYHDNEPNSVMNPVLTGASTQFSGTSLTAMKGSISSNFRCISRLPEHQTDLSVGSSSQETFNASVAVTSLRAEECSVGLYAQALVGGKPYGPFYRVASTKSFFDAGNQAITIPFSSPMPQGPAQPADVVFLAKTWCRSRTYLSNSQVLRVVAGSTGASSSLPSDGRGWIQLLRKAFEPSK